MFLNIYLGKFFWGCVCWKYFWDLGDLFPPTHSRRQCQSCLPGEQIWNIVLFEFVRDFGVQNPPPYPHPRRQCQSSLRGKKYGNKYLLVMLCDSYENIDKNNEKCTKMITSCSIHPVGRWKKCQKYILVLRAF